MCAARITKESPPRSAHSPGRASGVRSAGLDSSATDPPTETSSLLLTNRTSFRFHERLGLFQVYLLKFPCRSSMPRRLPERNPETRCASLPRSLDSPAPPRPLPLVLPVRSLPAVAHR